MNIKSKTKPLLITITLMSTSLFGSDPTKGKLPVLQEKQQDVSQTITEEEVFPPFTRGIINLFNMSNDVLKLKTEYDSRQQKTDTMRINYGKKLAQKQHANNRIVIRKHLNIKDIYDLLRQYEEKFITKLCDALEKEESPLLECIYLFIAPYVRCAFYELIQYPVDRELFSIFQKLSIQRLKVFAPTTLVTEMKNILKKPSSNPYIRMLQECSLEQIKNIDFMKDFYSGLSLTYEQLQKLNSLSEQMEIDKNIVIKQQIQYEDTQKKELTQLVDFCNRNKIELPKEINDISTILSLLQQQSEGIKQNFAADDAFKTVQSQICRIKHINDGFLLLKEQEQIKKDLLREINRTDEEINQQLQEIEASETRQKTVSKINTPKQKQTPTYGRKAIPNTVSIPEIQKQMRQIPTHKTQKDLDAKFGEDLAKQLDELEIITIDFESEEDWKEFVNEAKVEFCINHRDSSHESQEIFFDFEGQRIKGQLLTYHLHGKDAQEETTRRIRITRRVQK